MAKGWRRHERGGPGDPSNPTEAWRGQCPTPTATVTRTSWLSTNGRMICGLAMAKAGGASTRAPAALGIPATHEHGVATLDANGDGHADVLVVNLFE